MNDLNIIIPVHNEEKAIGEFTHRLLSALQNSRLNYKFIFVNDHSTDFSVDEIKMALKKEFPKLTFKKSRRRTKFGNIRYQEAGNFVIVNKLGSRGRATSILLGHEFCDGETVAIIDSDLSYPPEAVVPMYKLSDGKGLIIGNRKINASLAKKLKINLQRLFVDKLLLNSKHDTHSGLKVLKTEILDHISTKHTGNWSLDMHIVKTALDLGYEVDSFDIDYHPRKYHRPSINIVQKSAEIPWNALKLRLSGNRIYQIKSKEKGSMVGASIIHKGASYTTHTHLPIDKSAIKVLEQDQALVILGVIGVIILGLIFNPKTTTITGIAVLSIIYFADILFSLYTLLKSLHFPPELNIPEEKLNSLNDKDLPIYSIMAPLYKEANVLPHFIESLDLMDYPKNKLDVMLLLEENDRETIDAAKNMDLPDYVRIIIIPHSLPKTKPKACNYGLNFAKGEYVVVYDAEDKPDPKQLKKSYLAFKQLGHKYACLQSKLNYYNTDQNLLTRLFTAEYSLWFDLTLPGLQSINTTIPLGGTSNHFRTADLRRINGWDPFNVTEDCDLGVRLFKLGKKTAIINSVTYEEANSHVGNWIRQRSRWLKGYFQTYFVHMRKPLEFVKDYGIHALIFQFVIGLRISFILINPVLWAMTIAYFTLYQYVGPQIEALFPPVIFYIAVFSLVFGNFMYLYNYMIGAAKHGKWSVIKFVFLIPFYWLMTSWAAVIAFYQLVVKPHYWEKTNHGLNLKGPVVHKLPPTKRASLYARLADNTFAGGGSLIVASMFANAANFLYNAYLGRRVNLEEFGTVSLISNIFALVSVVTNALSGTISHKSAYLLGKFEFSISNLWKNIRGSVIFMTICTLIIWLASIPLMMNFFNTSDPLPFLLFTPAWLGIIKSVDIGYLNGNLKFPSLALITFTEAFIKLLLAFLFVEKGYAHLVYASIPISVIITFGLAYFFATRVKASSLDEENKVEYAFPAGFFGTSILTGLSAVAFLSFDIILAKHFLTPELAGQYALLSLSGKMIYFFGGLFRQFITPLVSNYEGANKNSGGVFLRLFIVSILSSGLAYLGVGVFGNYTIPILFGEKARIIIPLLPIYGLAILEFSTSLSIINYYQVKKRFIFPVLGFAIAILQVFGIYKYHESVQEIVYVIFALSTFQLLAVLVLHKWYSTFKAIYRNFLDLFGLFTPTNGENSAPKNKFKILIFNWRDTKHKWAGGAEVYIQELAKRWANEGHVVTLFCGNTNGNPRFENIEGVNIIRRGGFITVYMWAALYYIFRFRGKYDIIVDCENGVPFFTPLFSRTPKVLVIHHVHSEVFRKHLVFPLAQFALFLESKFMPFVYRNIPIVTVSESSKKDILNLALRNNNIYIANPGVKVNSPERVKKTDYPSFVYVGRLQHYKNVDTAVRAFARVAVNHPKAIFNIAGSGESFKKLHKLVIELGLKSRVKLLGRISDKLRNRLYAKSWAAIQPSSFEGWGITTIEANTFATPVIASNVNGLRDSVVNGKTGLLIPPKDVKEWANAMDKIITDKSLRIKLSRDAQIWSQKFKWRYSSKVFMDVFKKELIKTDIDTNKEKVLAYLKSK